MLTRIKASVTGVIKQPITWVSLLLGISLVFAYAPFSLWWLPFPVLIIWLYKVKDLPRKQFTQQGFFFALGWFGAGISWVHVSIAEFGGVPLVFSILLMLILCAYLALFPALACYLSHKLSFQNKVNLWLFPSVWMLTEYCRNIFLTGFPWLSLGYSQIDSPLAVLAPVIGEVGITFMMLLLAVITIKVFVNRSRLAIGLLIIFGVSLISVSNSSWVKATGESKKVALIQGNISQDMKWKPEQELPTMLKYLDLSRQNYDAEIHIWPESAIPAMGAYGRRILRSCE